MNSFIFNDAIRFKLATQQEDTNAKVQVFLGVFFGVLLRWIYSIAVEVIKTMPPGVLVHGSISSFGLGLRWSQPSLCFPVIGKR